MSESKKKSASKSSEQGYEFEYRRRKIRIVEPDIDARSGLGEGESRLYIDDEEIPIEVTERGVLSHEMAFKEYGTIDELAEDIVRQRGTAHIVKGDQPPHDHKDHNHEH